MNRNDAFSRCHPLVNFLYFALVLLGAMLLQHPVCQAISLIGAIACFCCLGGEKPGGFRLWYALVLFAVTAAVNPAFSHEGRTILRYLPSETPDARVHFIRSSARGSRSARRSSGSPMLHAVMTSDKFVYLFRKNRAGAESRLSMTLRFVPRFSAQANAFPKRRPPSATICTREALLHRVKCALMVFSISSDMVSGERGRHGGLHARPGLRTSRKKRVFDLYAHKARQTAARGVMGLLGGNRCGRLCLRRALWRYYPSCKGAGFVTWTSALVLAELILLLNLIPVNSWSGKEAAVCRRLQSQI